ncbi:GNAT family protein [Pseudomonas sp. 10B1]|uniref:GNAT family N-acetyltransferase n=2 Tax=Pseudomonas TaxID=286 RepID=UPI002AB42FF3|nr:MULTISPECIES: GNAT family protein [unclassified Pseudomonas]MDY7563257.1 GNAT family protein [Pseudomonas sp. AB6]MEA9979187.1 GNAT family protein [Pseudomonas sp. RTS4]MEA9996962.1 GNAT family protein [Pseudomonas sp. AA4]MEB0089146.1 GNAT family protein [Pseudomonas sp. RTI1]MEB0127217.1 GNAT family protein [Pseudomonas sp. CCC1.2]
MTTLIQRLIPDHASAYRALMLEAYRLHPDAFTSDVEEREALSIGWWEKRLDIGSDAADVVFAAFEGLDLLGVVGLSVEKRRKANHKSTLFGMYVPLAHREKGIGYELLRTVLAFAKSQPQLLLVQLTVTEGNRGAQGLYERMGFKLFGVEPLAVAVGRRFVSKVHMWHDLRSTNCEN